tara:strand:- start:90 stop:860 length:771 start_codon:yes stop_codon:yes gene_type:complete
VSTLSAKQPKSKPAKSGVVGNKEPSSAKARSVKSKTKAGSEESSKKAPKAEPTKGSVANASPHNTATKTKPAKRSGSKQAYTLPAKQKARLERGEIMVWSQNIKGFEIPRVYAKAILPGTAAKNWKLISDCRILKKIVPAVERVEVRKERSKGQTCWLLVDAPWPFSDLTSVLQYTRQAKADGYAMSFFMIKGDYDRNRGHWSLKPYGDKGDRTLLKYWIHSVPHTTAPNSFIKWGTKSNLKTMFKRLIQVCKKAK